MDEGASSSTGSSNGNQSSDFTPGQQANIIQQFAEMAARATSGEGISDNTFRRAYASARDEVLRGRSHVTISMPEHNQEAPSESSTATEDTLPAEDDGTRAEDRNDPQNDLRAQYSRLRVHFQNNRDAQTIYALLSAFIPFLLLFIIKGFVDHWKPISLVASGFVIMMSTERNLLKIVAGAHGAHWVILDLVLILGFEFVLSHYYDIQLVIDGLFFNISNMTYMSFGDTIYLIVITDFCCKMLVILLKTLLAVLPERLLTIKRRRRFFQLFEYASQMYRSILPIPRWSIYFLGPSGYMETTYSDMLFFGTYLMLKAREVLTSYPPLLNAAKMIFRLSSYGTTPSREELARDPKCCICYEDMKSPIKLICNHLFCEECVDTWLDEKHTCPMCRTTVDQEDNTWKSGQTTRTIRLY